MKTKDRISRIGTWVALLLLFLLGVWFTDQAPRATTAAKPESVKTAEPVVSTEVGKLPPWSEVQPANHGTNPIPDGFVQTAVYENVARLAFPTPAPVGAGLRARVLLGEISGATGRHKFVRIEEVASIKENRLVERRVMPADHVAVILHKGKTEAELRAALPEGLVVRRKLLTEERYLIGFEAHDAMALPGALQKLQGMKLLVNAATADGYVFSAGAGANRVCPNDPMFPQQWSLQSPVENDAETQRDMDAPEAWALGTGSSSVAVAIIDSGMDYLHPDLAPNLWTNPGETGLDALGNDKATNGLDDDNSGFADDVHGHDFANDDNDAMDDFGHGTHVAGIIGAKGNNGIGISGVCWDVSLVPLKTLTNRGGGIWSDIVDAVNYASRLGIPIANCSFGAYGAAPLFVNSAFEQAHNVLFCCAAGNGALRDSGSIVGDNIDEIPFMPAGLPAGHLISVAAHAADTSANFLAEFSNYGRTSVDMAAPGVGILSTMPGSNYASKSGTSMACAFVSGTTALMLSKRTNACPLQLRQMLQVCSKQRGHELTTSGTGGRVWMWRSLVWAVSGQEWRQLGSDGNDVYQVGVGSEAKYWGSSGNGDPQGGPSMVALFREGADSGWLPFVYSDGSPGWIQTGADIHFQMADFDDPIVQVQGVNGIPVLITVSGKLYFSNDTEDEPVILSELSDIARVCGSSAGGYYAIGRNGNLWRLQDPLDSPAVLMPLPPIRGLFTDPNGENTFCTTLTGEVYGWGTNLAGALGSGDLTARTEPVLLPLWTGAREFQFGTPGTSITFAIMGDGRVKACGESSDGLFGASGITSSLTPREIIGLTQIRSLEIGDCGTALDLRGRVFEWGSKGHYGGVDGVRVESVLPVPLTQPVMEMFVMGTTSVALMSDGTSVSWGEDVSGLRGLGQAEAQYVNTPRRVPALDQAVSILGGAATTVLLADGDCFTVGVGPNGVATGIRTPLPPAPDGVELVVEKDLYPAAGGRLYMDAEGNVFERSALGWNPTPTVTGIARMTKSTGIIFQETPFANRLNRFEKITGISTDGNVISIGSAPVIGCPWVNPSQIVQIADGGYGVLILREDGLLYTARPDGVFTGQTGSFNGRFINPDGSPFWGPKLINCPLVADLPGLNYVLTQDGRVFRWPDNPPVIYPINDGDISMVEVAVPQRFPGAARSPIVKMVENLTLHADGSVSFFGATGPEQIELNPASGESYVVTEFTDAVDIWAGNGRWFVKKAHGEVWAWGNNSAGSLGDLTGMTDPTPTLAFGFSDEVSVAVTLGDWLAQYFSEEDLGSINISGDEADPDRDGLVNLVEYALGSDPTLPSDGDGEDSGLTCSFETVSSEALSADGNGGTAGELHFTVKLKRRAKRPGIEYRVEFSDDMVTWSSGPDRLLKVLESEKTVIYRDIHPLSVTQRRWARLLIRKGN